MSRTFPEILEKYKNEAFWDTPLSAIDEDRHRDFVIERLLQYGGMEGVRWLLANVGDDAIKSVVIHSPNLSRMTATFWSVYFDIPSESVRCLSEPTLSPRK